VKLSGAPRENELGCALVPSAQSGAYGVPSKSSSLATHPATEVALAALFGPAKQLVSSASPPSPPAEPAAVSSKCPISVAKLTLAKRAVHGVMCVEAAVLYSGRKLKPAVAHVAGLVFLKPLAELETMEPKVEEVRSMTSVSRATPLSLIVTTRLSPGFMRRVLAFGVYVAAVCAPGAGGPVGTPFLWMKAKLTGSMQPLLFVKLSMFRAAHHWVWLQLTWLTKGSQPGG